MSVNNHLYFSLFSAHACSTPFPIPFLGTTGPSPSSSPSTHVYSAGEVITQVSQINSFGLWVSAQISVADIQLHSLFLCYSLLFFLHFFSKKISLTLNTHWNSLSSPMAIKHKLCRDSPCLCFCHPPIHSWHL